MCVTYLCINIPICSYYIYINHLCFTSNSNPKSFHLLFLALISNLVFLYPFIHFYFLFYSCLSTHVHSSSFLGLTSMCLPFAHSNLNPSSLLLTPHPTVPYRMSHILTCKHYCAMFSSVHDMSFIIPRVCNSVLMHACMYLIIQLHILIIFSLFS